MYFFTRRKIWIISQITKHQNFALQKLAEASPHAFANDQRVAVLLVRLLSGFSSTIFYVDSYLRQCELAITFFLEKFAK